MADSNELARRTVTTRDGTVTATVYDRVSVGRVAAMLFKGSASAIFAGATDNTPNTADSLKTHVVAEPQE